MEESDWWILAAIFNRVIIKLICMVQKKVAAVAVSSNLTFSGLRVFRTLTS